MAPESTAFGPSTVKVVLSAVLALLLSGWSTAPAAQGTELGFAIWDRLLELELARRLPAPEVRLATSVLLNGDDALLLGLAADFGNADVVGSGPRWQYAFGPRVIGLARGGAMDEFVAIGVGGALGASFAVGTVPILLSIHGQGFPEALVTSGGVSRVTEYGVRADARVLPGATAFAGVRRFEVSRAADTPTADIDSGFRIGVRILFR
jgi:hypothetical protein